MTERLPRVVLWRRAVLAADLSPVQKLVALALTEHMNGQGASCYPSIALLARETAIGRRAVQYAIAELEHAGFIERSVGGRGRARAGPGDGRERRSSEYRAVFPAGERVHGGAPFTGEKVRTSAPERVHGSAGKGAPPCTRGSEEGDSEVVPPSPPRGGEQHRGADAHEEDRLAALDIDPRPFGVEEGASDAAR